MRLLHLFSNHKLTGPAAPALNLAAELQKRGHEVMFAHTPLRRKDPGYIDSAAAELGLPTTTEFYLPKHYGWVTLWKDIHKLAAFIDRHGVDLIHCNLLNDHVTAVNAVRYSKRKPKIVRTNHSAMTLRRLVRNRYIFRRTAALIELSRAAMSEDIGRFHLAPERTFLVDSAIDLVRFDPARPLPDMRGLWGVGRSEFVVGIAARIQRHRRFDVLLDAAVIARKAVPNLRLVIIGRGTEKESVAVRPAMERGLGETVIFPGYLRGDEYVGGLRALDVKVFMMPGTDGSCRAVREAMALGVPVAAARRGMLPELITDGVDGRIFDDSAENLAAAIIDLARDDEGRDRMGKAARETALRRFDPAKQAEQVEKIYQMILS